MAGDLKLIGFVVLLSLISANCEDCEQLDGKQLLAGCDLLKGVSIVSQGGTLVNDSNCDVLLPKLVFAKEPKVFFGKAEEKKVYTVITVDPDAPNHTPGHFYLHMIKTNIAGPSLVNGDITTGTDVKSYIGPGPPEGTNDHRYLFLVYEQNSPDIKVEAPEIRARFELSAWLKDKPICGPLAAVQFKARFEL